MPKKKTNTVPSELTESEQALLTHMQQGLHLETDSLGGNPVLRQAKSDEVIRPLSVNRNTIKSLEKRGLILPGKGSDPLTIGWRLAKRAK